MTKNQYTTSMHAYQKLVNGEHVCLNVKFYKIHH